MESDDDNSNINVNVRNSQTPSVNSQNYAIPITEDMISQLLISASSSESDIDSNGGSNMHNSADQEDIPSDVDNPSDSASLTSEILESANEILQNSINNDNDILRRTTTAGTMSNNFVDISDQNPHNMIDVSKYVFESLKQAIDSADFSECLSYQTKTSGQINAKSLELKQLIDKTQSRLLFLQDRFEKGAQVSKNVRNNLSQTKKRIDRINDVLRTDYPIEFSQATEKIMERTLNEDIP